MKKRNVTSTLLLLGFLAASQGQVVLQRCDRANLWNGSNAITVDQGDAKEGTGALQFTGDGTHWFSKQFSQTHTGVDETGYLSLWLYVSDPDAFSGEGSVEISSSGGPDSDEYSWNLASLGLTAGWNSL